MDPARSSDNKKNLFQATLSCITLISQKPNSEINRRWLQTNAPGNLPKNFCSDYLNHHQMDPIRAVATEQNISHEQPQKKSKSKLSLEKLITARLQDH